MKAVIVAGGKGERLKPFTDNVPKPMIKVGGKPILEYIINGLKKNGVKEIIISLCYLPEQIEEYFKDGTDFDVNITYTFEDPEKPLGTAGAILPAKIYLSEDFIVTYADIIRELNIENMIKIHNDSKSLATLNVYKHRGENHKSTLLFDKDNFLTSFEEHSSSQNLKEGFSWSNGSFYIFKPEIFEYIPKDVKTDFSKDIFPKLLSLNKKISVFPSDSYFIDIGTKESLDKAREDNK